MIKESDLENIKYKTVYDYYDQPLSFTFELYSKLYYANLIDYEEDTNTDIYWVNKVDIESIKQTEEGKLPLYDLMTGVEGKQYIYIITSQKLEDREIVTRLTLEQVLNKYAHLLPEREEYLVKENVMFIKEGED